MAYGHVSTFLLRILMKRRYYLHIYHRPQYLSPIMALIVMNFVLVFFILPSQARDNIIQSNIAVGLRHSIAIKSNKAVVSIGENRFGQCNVKSWTDIVQVVAGWHHSVGLKSNGSVVSAGHNDSGQRNVSSWTDILQIAAGWYHTVGLKSDGSVVATIPLRKVNPFLLL